MDRSSRQKINKGTVALNNTLEQKDFIDIFWAFHPKVAELPHFSRTHGMLSRVDHMLGLKRSFNKFKKIEIIWSIFSDHNAMKPGTNHKKNTEKHTDTEVKQHVIKQWMWQQRDQGRNVDMKRCFETNENEDTKSKIWGTLAKKS